MHCWKGELDMEKRGRTMPINPGHEHMGTVFKLGAGVTTDSSGQPLREGDRVIYRYFIPCGRCKACLRRQFKSCPTRQSNWSVTCDVWPHFQGGYGDYFYLGPNHAIFKLPAAITDAMAAGINCAFAQVYAGLEFAGFKGGQTVALKGALDLMVRTRQRYPYEKIISHTFPLEKINEAFRQQEDGHITRGAIAPA